MKYTPAHLNHVRVLPLEVAGYRDHSLHGSHAEVVVVLAEWVEGSRVSNAILSWEWEYCSPATLPSVSYPDLHALPAKERLVFLMNFLANASRINLKLLYTYQASMPKPTSPAVEYL